MIDKDNLKSNESVGTFRWNDSITLINVPGKSLFDMLKISKMNTDFYSSLSIKGGVLT